MKATAMTITEGKMPAPITQAPPHEGLIPHTYVAVRKSQFCLCCHRTHVWTECYAKTHIRSSNESAWGRKYGTNLRKLDAPRYRLPIEQQRGPHETIPFCHACYRPTLDDPTLLEPPAPKADWNVLLWRGTGLEQKPEAKPPTKAKPKRPTASLDDLEDMLR